VLGERVCGGRYLGYTVELLEELFYTAICSREFKKKEKWGNLTALTPYPRM